MYKNEYIHGSGVWLGEEFCLRYICDGTSRLSYGAETRVFRNKYKNIIICLKRATLPTVVYTTLDLYNISIITCATDDSRKTFEIRYIPNEKMSNIY